ncbi:MAG: DUF2572 family protein, partial [Bacteroidetes bacterium]|nr:DUF2572 family protein [Bacteroidota bacterium]
MPPTTTDIGVFILVTTALILLLISFIILILLLFKRKQLIFGRDLELQKNEYERKLLSTQLEMQEQTMKHISREIHDNISALLSMAKLNLRGIGEEDEKNDRLKLDNSLSYVSR